MSSGGQKKTRLERVAALEMPPNMVERMLGDLQRGDVLLRIGLCFLSAIFLWAVVGAWAPPFAIRRGFVPDRDILARVEFKKQDDVATQTARTGGQPSSIRLRTRSRIARPIEIGPEE